MAETTYRISKVASELNVSFTTLVDKLSDKGFSVESKPTTKITEEMYQLLLSEFKSDKAAKDESKSLKISIPKTLKGTSGQDKLIKSAEKTTPPTLPPSDPDEEENDQIFVKDNLLKTPQASEDVTEKPPSEEKPSTTNEENNDQKVIRPDVIKPRILGKIDLDNLGKGKKSPKITEEKTISEKELEVSEKVDIKPLDSTDVLTNPENTTHLSPPQQEENLATVEKESDASPNETPVSSDTTEHVEVTDTTDKDRSSAINEVPESEKTSPSENIIEQ
jgi:translation initiation factor IF-2